MCLHSWDCCEGQAKPNIAAAAALVSLALCHHLPACCRRALEPPGQSLCGMKTLTTASRGTGTSNPPPLRGSATSSPCSALLDVSSLKNSPGWLAWLAACGRGGDRGVHLRRKSIIPLPCPSPARAQLSTSAGWAAGTGSHFC